MPRISFSKIRKFILNSNYEGIFEDRSSLESVRIINNTIIGNSNIVNTRFTDVDYIPIFTEVNQFDSYTKVEDFCSENSSKSI